MDKARLNHNDRINLHAAIAKGLSLKQISSVLGKARSSIYREIINNCRYYDCKHTCSNCSKTCRARREIDSCDDFTAIKCLKWKKFPYTCNVCDREKVCRFRKRFYDYCEAHEKAKENRSVPRQGKQVNDKELKVIDDIVSRGVKLGQSLHHIYIANNDELVKICTERTIRRYVEKRYLQAKAHELPRYVRYSKKYEIKRRKTNNVARLFQRTFADYKNYVDTNKNMHIWQYDSVEGKQEDKKAILTITYPKYRFQFGYLINKHEADSVMERLKSLQKLLGEKYNYIFQVNLSDNGSEFDRFHELESNDNGELICRVFFTTPYRSNDKSSCERNHEFIRYVIPKGKSLDNLTQAKVNLMFSHINSYVRESNKNKTPYILMLRRFGIDFLKIIGIRWIDEKDVHLKPDLLF